MTRNSKGRKARPHSEIQVLRTQTLDVVAELRMPEGAKAVLDVLQEDELRQAAKHAKTARTALGKLIALVEANRPAAPEQSEDPVPVPEQKVVPVLHSSSTMTPTSEQDAIIEACASGDNLVVEAGAGTGKTTTLKMAAGAMRGRGLYIAFNKAIATEAKASFPASVDCRTAHSLAYGVVGRLYGRRMSLRVPAWRTAELLRIVEPLRVNKELLLAPKSLARLASEAVDRFCHSAAEEVQLHHIPRLEGTTSGEMEALRQEILPHARKLWRETQAFDSPHRFTHDYYLKLWALQKPKLRADYVLLDEAQDSNPVVAQLIQGQSAQRIAVGDSSQSIYGWRGATDALATWPAKRRLQLTQSWRFGEAIAAEANAWLAQIEGSIRIRGNPNLDSQVVTGELMVPHAVLCYTNAGAVNRAMLYLDDGLGPALVGGGQHIRDLAVAALDLRDQRPVSHPDLIAFQSWEQLEEFANTEGAGGDLKAFVKLINDHGPEIVIKAVDCLVAEERADVVLSTAHKAKGREWDTVMVEPDFPCPKEGTNELLDPPLRDKAMLGYVTVTRAKGVLDNLGLAWIHKCANGPERRAAATPDDSDLPENDRKEDAAT
ncbi:UvrD-helicase domain-containing protein [Streptomyces chattanoogensis]|uniref:UvrD-helicase domain-containing protein n=1 Tax=Streptomyces chattanoogensis TaxID=66876 RepID=UPI0036A9E039